MKLIKNAIVYRATLPDAAALAEHLAEKPFVPVPELHASSSGFIPHPTTEKLVSTFPGGLAFRLRRDFKPVSKSAIKLASQGYEAMPIGCDHHDAKGYCLGHEEAPQP